mmetsp:Transcript_93861/g.210305  ORF Transcript_93861/g.210305 Transcript_93861/m.210305 type:complete len:218 (+) Transcript_93861:174-827(+)
MNQHPWAERSSSTGRALLWARRGRLLQVARRSRPLVPPRAPLEEGQRPTKEVLDAPVRLGDVGRGHPLQLAQLNAEGLNVLHEPVHGLGLTQHALLHHVVRARQDLLRQLLLRVVHDGLHGRGLLLDLGGQLGLQVVHQGLQVTDALPQRGRLLRHGLHAVRDPWHRCRLLLDARLHATDAPVQVTDTLLNQGLQVTDAPPQCNRLLLVTAVALALA